MIIAIFITAFVVPRQLSLEINKESVVGNVPILSSSLPSGFKVWSCNFSLCISNAVTPLLNLSIWIWVEVSCLPRCLGQVRINIEIDTFPLVFRLNSCFIRSSIFSLDHWNFNSSLVSNGQANSDRLFASFDWHLTCTENQRDSSEKTQLVFIVVVFLSVNVVVNGSFVTLLVCWNYDRLPYRSSIDSVQSD